MVVSSQYVNELLRDPAIFEENNSTLFLNDLSNSSIPDQEEIEDNVSRDNELRVESLVEVVVAPDVPSLTILFFVLYVLAATQDVAVDGWALTMLKPGNVGYASTCNAVGQTTGWVLGYVVFTSLEAYGILDLGQFTLLWGIVFLVITTSIAIFKKEKSISEIQESLDDGEEKEEKELNLGLIEAYKMLWFIIWSPRIYLVIIFLMTSNFGFSAAENIFNLKLIEFGVPKESIAQLALPMIPVKILVTVFISRFTVGPRPMNVWLGCFPVRLFFCLALTALVSRFWLETEGLIHFSVSVSGLRNSDDET